MSLGKQVVEELRKRKRKDKRKSEYVNENGKKKEIIRSVYERDKQMKENEKMGKNGQLQRPYEIEVRKKEKEKNIEKE